MNLTENQQLVTELKTKIEEQQKEIENLQEQIILLSYVKMYDV
jgi:cell division protein FtsL